MKIITETLMETVSLMHSSLELCIEQNNIVEEKLYFPLLYIGNILQTKVYGRENGPAIATTNPIHADT